MSASASGFMTAEEIQVLLSYNPDTGVFTWNQDRGTRPFKGRIAGTLSPEGYVRIGIKGKIYPAHRLVFFLLEGVWPDCVDHINHDRQDNRVCNLRKANRQQNARNRKPNAKSTSIYLGVHKHRDKWRAQLRTPQKQYHLGVFTDEVAAAKAYDHAAKTHYGVYANLNFKEDV